MAVIGLIPARSGSKSISKKSIALCAGRPLMAYTCEAALATRLLDRVILSTDDAEIQDVGRQYGIDVPFTRPAELATDETPMIAVVRHALGWLRAEGSSVEAVVLLQPTSPLRSSRHIDESLELFRDSGADTVVSVVEVPHQFNPVSLLKIVEGRLSAYLPDQPQILRRQDKPKVYARNGPAVLVMRPRIIESGQFYSGDTRGYVMDRMDSLDVDDFRDLKLAELLLIDRGTRQRQATP